jgi:YVTN family beta-propeller protein
VGLPPDEGVPPDGVELTSAGLQSGDDSEADVHAFLIADMRGYTAFTQDHGDEGGARLAARFAQVTRAVVETHRGRIVELRGDEALVVFSSPRWAIRGAIALQQRFVEETIADPSRPLTVGIGLDAGEAVPVEGGYRGGALNVAGRLCSRARAGEVLASREIVHLARRLEGITFTEVGDTMVKGLDQPVHVVAVRSEERDAAEAIAPFVRGVSPTTSHRRRNIVVGAVAFVVLVAAIAVPLASREAGAGSRISPNSIGILDPDSGKLISSVELDDRPGAVAASRDAVWVTNPDAGTVTQIDPSDQQVRDRIRVGEHLTGIAVGFGAVWVVDTNTRSVSRISPEEHDVVETIAVGNGPEGVATGEGSVWVTNRFDGTVSRIDPRDGTEIEVIPVGLDPQGVVVGFGSIWVGLAGSNTVVRIDPETNKVTQPIGVGNGPVSLALSSDAVWVVNALDETVMRINPNSNSVVATIGVGSGASKIAVVNGIVWAANEADGTLSQIERDQTIANTIVVGSIPQGFADVGGHLWVSVRGTATTHQGGTLRLVSKRSPGSLDPGTSYDDIAYQIMHLLGDGLLAFEPVGGTNPGLTPDLATSVPNPTDGGLTYRFEVRSGILYSDGRSLALEDFRRGIERIFRLQSGAAYLMEGIVGATACVEAPTCDLSRGIQTDPTARTVTFHLEAPDPEFLDKLTMPFTYPIPDVPDQEQQTAGLPGTGPYMLAAPMTEEGVTLVRNPRFDVWSSNAQPAGYVDQIEWRFGLDADRQVEAVAAGEADIAFDASKADRLDDLFVRFAARTHAHPTPGTYWVSLDTSSPPFDDADVRRAINLAIDRDRVVEAFGGEWAASATCQHLPPNFPGYEPYCPYTKNAGPDGLWSAPVVDQAK